MFILCGFATMARGSGGALAAEIKAGDLIVANTTSPIAVRIEHISAGSHAITQVSRGGLLVSPFDIAVTSDGAVLVVDGRNGIVRVDAATGAQSLAYSAAEFGGAQPQGIEIEPAGSLLVTTWWRDGSHPDAVYRISGSNPVVLTSGGYLKGPAGIARGADGDIYVVDPLEPPGSYLDPARGSVVRIDPVSGAQKTRYVSSSFRGPGQIAVASDGSLAIAQYGAMAAGYGGGIFRIDATTGTISTLVATNACSNLTSAGGGGPLYYSHTVTTQSRSTYYVRRNDGSLVVTGVSGPMAVAPANTNVTSIVPASWGSVKARYR
jgi:streptogramin lyase